MNRAPTLVRPAANGMQLGRHAVPTLPNAGARGWEHRRAKGNRRPDDWLGAHSGSAIEVGSALRADLGPPQGGRGYGRGFAAPSVEESTMNRAPTQGNVFKKRKTTNKELRTA